MELSSTAAIWVLTVVLAVVPIWAWQRLNSLWLRPKRFERLLRAQGLQGDPYKVSVDNPKQVYMLKMQEEAKSKSIGLTNDAAPRIFSPVHHAVHKYGTRVVPYYTPGQFYLPFSSVINDSTT